MHVTHTFAPVYDKNSRILILGTFPSVKSRENAFYYGHPQNRFWKVIAALMNEPVPISVEEKKEILTANKIAVWDVLYSCDIEGSDDSSIQNEVPNDITSVLSECPIKEIYGNGAKACALYRKYCEEQTKRPIIGLPSTSPANAAFSLERLLSHWKQIQEGLIES